MPGRTALPRPANEGHAAVAPMRLAAEVRRVERQPAAFTAGERLTVASEITGGNETSRPSASRPRFSMVRFVMLTVLLVLAGIGAMTVYRAVTDFVLG